MRTKIIGTGSYAPDRVVTNNHLAEIVETSDEWIQERTGVIRRHIVKEETTVSMAAEAGRRALENAGVSAEELDLILVATISSNVILPCTACEVQRSLGAVNATCFDLGGAACTGFVLAYNTAEAYLASGVYKTVLIIGSESLSSITNWKDRGTCILFGDGAGAVYVEKCEDGGILGFVQHSDGSRGHVLSGACRALENPFFHQEQTKNYIKMDGREIFSFAVRQIPKTIEEALARAELSAGEVDLFLLHQANRRIIEGISKRLGVDMDRFPMNLERVGNTSSASIPLLLDEINRKGALKPGMRLVLSGFGGGLTCGACVVEWQ